MVQNILSISFILFLLIGTPALSQSNQSSCPDHAPALTPAALQEEWAVEWWLPRHEA